MTSSTIGIFLNFALLTASLPAQNTLTAEEKAAGWKLLFDGKTMKNWDDPRQKHPAGDAWSIEDGCIKANAKPKITEDLFSKETYTDFEFAFEWKISPAGNSGVKYLIQDHLFVKKPEPGQRFEDTVEHALQHRETTRQSKGQDYVIGFEFQMIDNDANKDAHNGTTHTAGALYDIAPPLKDATKPVGEWNQSRIVLKGNHVEHWLNGEKVVDATLEPSFLADQSVKRWGKSPTVFDMLTQHRKKDCPISLQNHDSDAWFRNIKIRRF
jgi:hypothetical protein